MAFNRVLSERANFVLQSAARRVPAPASHITSHHYPSLSCFMDLDFADRVRISLGTAAPNSFPLQLFYLLEPFPRPPASSP